LIDTKFLDQLARFSLVVHKRVTSSYTGPRRSIALGRGLTFKDYRIYAPGDDFRSIDWKVYARTDDLYVKTYEEERNLVVHIIVDSSSSMDFGQKIKKFEFASMIGIGCAYLALKENEKFQFSTFSGDIEIFQPKKGMSQLAAMVEYLNNIKIKGDSKIKETIYKYKKFIGSRSLIILVSDFLVNFEEIAESLPFLGNHEIKVVQVLDPVEKELKFSGDFKFKDSETGIKLRTYVDPRLRQVYEKMLEDHSGKIHELCDKLGMEFYQITTDTPIFDAFYRILE